MPKLSNILGGVILIGLLIGGFMAYMVSCFDAASGQWSDGFGRALSDSPLFMRMLFGESQKWAGWYWFIGDMVIFWAGIAVAFGLFSLGDKDPQ